MKSFFHLIQQLHTQTEPAYCGLATLVMVLNAMAIDPEQNWKGPWRWYEEQMFNCCLDLEDVKQTGITLKDFRCLAHCQGLSVDLQFCEDSSLEEFRQSIQRTCMEEESRTSPKRKNKNNIETSTNYDGKRDDTFTLEVGGMEDDSDDDDDMDAKEDEKEDVLEEVLVVSYCRKVIQQTGCGHFATLAAYDPQSDSVLILDTARFKYGSHWIKVPLLYDAMNTFDPATGKTRGFVILSSSSSSNNNDNNNNTKTNPIRLRQERRKGQDGGEDEVVDGCSIVPVTTTSILFRSKMTQNPKRRLYKEYLQSLTTTGTEITWQQTFDFWKDKEEQVWSIIEPLRLPKKGPQQVQPIQPQQIQQREQLHQYDDCLLQRVLDVRRLIASLLSLTVQNEKEQRPCCKGSDGIHTQCMSENQALYVVYLASLSEERRREIILDTTSTTPTTTTTTTSSTPDSTTATDDYFQASIEVREQLIMEANLIATAILFSDESSF